LAKTTSLSPKSPTITRPGRIGRANPHRTVKRRTAVKPRLYRRQSVCVSDWAGGAADNSLGCTDGPPTAVAPARLSNRFSGLISRCTYAHAKVAHCHTKHSIPFHSIPHRRTADARRCERDAIRLSAAQDARHMDALEGTQATQRGG
jgi:hypothetical protein